MSSLLAILGQPNDNTAVRQMERMLAKSPYHGPTQIFRQADASIAIQTQDTDSLLIHSQENVLALDGYISNWPEICALYNLPKSHAPTPEQLHIWSHNPLPLLAKLTGEFALVQLNLKTGQGLTATSLNGMRPLFYSEHGQQLVIATEISQLLVALSSAPKPHADAIAEHLCFGGQAIQREQTLYQGVRRFLAPNAYAFNTAQATRLQPRRYWSPPDELPPQHLTRQEAANALHNTVLEATRRALPAEPAVLALSGGMDSTSLWASLQSLAKQGNPSAAATRSLSMLFPGFDSDETPLIEAMLAHTGTTDGIMLDLTTEKPSDYFDQLSKVLDCPPTALSDFQLDILCRAVRDAGSHTLITGHGGDLFYSGSRYYTADLLHRGQLLKATKHALSLQNKPGQRLRIDALRRLWHAGLATPGSWLSRLRGRNNTPNWLTSRYQSLNEEVGAEWRTFTATHGMARGDMLFLLATNQAGFGIELQVQRTKQLGVRLRTPLMDTAVIDLAFTLPQAHLQQGPYDKQLARLAWANEIPDAVLHKPQLTVHNHPLQADLALLDKQPAGDWLLADLGIVSTETLKTTITKNRQERQVPLLIGRLLRTEALLQSHFC